MSSGDLIKIVGLLMSPTGIFCVVNFEKYTFFLYTFSIIVRERNRALKFSVCTTTSRAIIT